VVGYHDSLNGCLAEGWLRAATDQHRCGVAQQGIEILRLRVVDNNDIFLCGLQQWINGCLWVWQPRIYPSLKEPSVLVYTSFILLQSSFSILRAFKQLFMFNTELGTYFKW